MQRQKNVINKKIAELRALAEKKGAVLNIDANDFFDDDHLDCTWYGEYLADIEYKGIEVYIGVFGDVRLDGCYNGMFIDYVNKSNSGAFQSDLYYGIPDDATLRRLMEAKWEKEDDDHLYVGNNNWVEYFVGDTGYSDVCNEDNVLEAIGEVLDTIEDIYAWYQERQEETKAGRCPYCKNGDCELCPDENPCNGFLYAQENCAYRGSSEPSDGMVQKLTDAPATKSPAPKKYEVHYAVSGFATVTVEADSEAEAKRLALEESYNLDFGALQNIDWDFHRIEEVPAE